MQFGVTNFLRKNDKMDFFETLQIVFEGIRGSGWQGDIAIDDFSLTVGSCEEGIPDPPGPTTPPPPGKFISWISGPPCDELGLFEKTEAQDSYLCFARIISLRTKLTHISSRENTVSVISIIASNFEHTEHTPF